MLDIKKIEEVLDYKFLKKELILEALTHPSFSKTKFERFELLGDSVLRLCITQILLENFPDASEGEISEWRAYLTSDTFLSDVALKIHLDKLIKIGKGEEAQGGRGKVSILSSCLESVLGAVFQDGGFNSSQMVIKKLFEGYIRGLPEVAEDFNPTGKFQEEAVKYLKSQPVFCVAERKGPPHKMEFKVQALVCGKVLGEGWGSSIKQARAEASRDALKKMKKVKRKIENLTEQMLS